MGDPRDVIATTLYTQSDATYEVERLADAILAAFETERWTICRQETNPTHVLVAHPFVPVAPRESREDKTDG